MILSESESYWKSYYRPTASYWLLLLLRLLNGKVLGWAAPAAIHKEMALAHSPLRHARHVVKDVMD